MSECLEKTSIRSSSSREIVACLVNVRGTVEDRRTEILEGQVSQGWGMESR